MTASRWVLTASYGVLLIVSIVLVARGSKIGLISGLFLVVSLLVIWREAHQVRAKRDLNNRG
ncbi:hypothetical protein [Kocuria rosea]|uniref:hypothetical protein n=1 Tax=Kocuria rosea TaxID=1275 RepID=UPI0011A9FDEB|nr:hypothetical protein [Kocuria rosea]